GGPDPGGRHRRRGLSLPGRPAGQPADHTRGQGVTLGRAGLGHDRHILGTAKADVRGMLGGLALRAKRGADRDY
ncbi:MAG TPA: hypothetical protein VK901_11400, partial [Nitrospiraceae bacterium]|nr:hypothetical protein [Nitrospiraceae bacterium]